MKTISNWGNIKQSHIHIIAAPEGEDSENVAELMTYNSKFDENTDLMIKITQQTPSIRNIKYILADHSQTDENQR